MRLNHPSRRRFPALFAPASLKLDAVDALDEFLPPFSGAFCAGLIEAAAQRKPLTRGLQFSGAFCAGLIEAITPNERGHHVRGSFPALFAPASLKPA